MNIYIYRYISYIYTYPRKSSSPSPWRVAAHRDVGLELLHGSSDHLVLQGIGKGEAQLDATPGAGDLRNSWDLENLMAWGFP